MNFTDVREAAFASNPDGTVEVALLLKQERTAPDLDTGCAPQGVVKLLACHRQAQKVFAPAVDAEAANQVVGAPGDFGFIRPAGRSWFNGHSSVRQSC